MVFSGLGVVLGGIEAVFWWFKGGLGVVLGDLRVI